MPEDLAIIHGRGMGGTKPKARRRARGPASGDARVPVIRTLCKIPALCCLQPPGLIVVELRAGQAITSVIGPRKGAVDRRWPAADSIMMFSGCFFAEVVILSCLKRKPFISAIAVHSMWQRSKHLFPSYITDFCFPPSYSSHSPGEPAFAPEKDL